MADEFDGCECVWSHEWAMQRLLNFIRQNQNECTDTNCIDVTGRLQQPSASTGDEEGNFTMMTMIMIFAMVMYFIRPESILKLTSNNKRNGGNPNGNNGGGPSSPPPTPPAVN
ncbi:small integral membrane protein 14 [Musca domestica]|uniref:Small integral membrane protein 14 n=1 Tax=Musca domestica TaxID=7370 RepID=A0A1I8N558_MUSDO|nr:small integral membrane protein 14 [Musca domestica]XP_058986769.1 small integral membrane protein 14 [Musca domestica]